MRQGRCAGDVDKEEGSFMKKFYVLLIGVLFFTSAGTAVAAEIPEPYTLVYHYSMSDLVDNKAIYEPAYFRQMEFYPGIDYYAATEEDRSAVGSLTIRNGTYYYFDYDGNRVDVRGEDKTFDLVYSSGSSSYIEFAPALDGRSIYFRGSDGFLQGTRYNWSMEALGYEHEGTVPNLRTHERQLATYVPYVERTKPDTFEWRMVSPENTGRALAIPYEGRYRVRVAGKNNLWGASEWALFESGETPEGSWTLPAGMDAQDVRRVFVDVHLREEGPQGPRYRYAWSFFVANRGNQGLVGESSLKNLPDLSVDEEITIQIPFSSGYYSYKSPNPILIADPSVLRQTGWEYDPDSRMGRLTLKALKAGNTSISILYEHSDQDDTIGYVTEPISVVVAGKGTGSGGGGCDAFALGFAALALAGILQAKVVCGKK
jgi:hypothetical protein